MIFSCVIGGESTFLKSIVFKNLFGLYFSLFYSMVSPANLFNGGIFLVMNLSPVSVIFYIFLSHSCSK